MFFMHRIRMVIERGQEDLVVTKNSRGKGGSVL